MRLLVIANSATENDKIRHFAWPHSKQDYRHDHRLIMLMVSVLGGFGHEAWMILHSEWWVTESQGLQRSANHILAHHPPLGSTSPNLETWVSSLLMATLFKVTTTATTK